jgi:hypothetical protein
LGLKFRDLVFQSRNLNFIASQCLLQRLDMLGNPTQARRDF